MQLQTRGKGGKSFISTDFLPTQGDSTSQAVEPPGALGALLPHVLLLLLPHLPDRRLGRLCRRFVLLRRVWRRRCRGLVFVVHDQAQAGLRDDQSARWHDERAKP